MFPEIIEEDPALAKSVLIVVWLICLAAFFVTSDGCFPMVGKAVFWLILAAHVVEAFVFRAKLQAAPGSLASNVALTMVFGVLHIGALPEPDATTD